MRTPLERLRQRFGGAVPSALPHTARQATAARSTQRHSSGCAAGATATDPLLCLARAASSGVIPPLDECHAVFGLDSQHTTAEKVESLSSSGIASSSSSSSGNGPATTAVELPDVATVGATAAPVQQHSALLPAAAAVVETSSVDVLPTITLDSSFTIQFGPASPDAVLLEEPDGDMDAATSSGASAVNNTIGSSSSSSSSSSNDSLQPLAANRLADVSPDVTPAGVSPLVVPSLRNAGISSTAVAGVIALTSLYSERSVSGESSAASANRRTDQPPPTVYPRRSVTTTSTALTLSAAAQPKDLHVRSASELANYERKYGRPAMSCAPLTHE
eukprot:15217-Heterococcus_DN1.PRE.1